MEFTFCAIDRSGSMASCLNDTIGGYNYFIDNQPEDSFIQTYLFDNNVKFFDRSIAKDATRLNITNYRPGGGTALLDAMGHVMTIASNCTADTTNILILTDGEENASELYTKFEIFKMVEERKREGWNFIFLGANQDAIAVSGELGIPQGSTMTFDTEQVKTVLKCASDALARVRSGESQEIEFSQDERSASCPIPL